MTALGAVCVVLVGVSGVGWCVSSRKSANLNAQTPKIFRLARRARGALRRLARLRRSGCGNLIFSHTGSKCYTLSDFDPPIRFSVSPEGVNNFGFSAAKGGASENLLLGDTYVFGFVRAAGIKF